MMYAAWRLEAYATACVMMLHSINSDTSCMSAFDERTIALNELNSSTSNFFQAIDL